MIERILENWLNKANERSFQIPFAHWLAFKGHSVLHLSRDCAMELGKDIVTIAPDGIPCAYQLKGVDGGRLTLGRWRDDLEKQVFSLVNLKIVHPSLNTKAHHRAYIVLNGDIDEEVQHTIDGFNRSLADSGFSDRKVETIVKGQLFSAFKELQSDFWATNLSDVKTYLELFLAKGNELLPRGKLCALFDDALPFSGDERPTDNACVRSLAGCAVTCASAVSAFTIQRNHMAEFEAWTLFWAYTMGLATRWNLPERLTSFASRISSDAMYSSLGRLCDELAERKTYIEGDIVADSPVYRVRMTHLLGLIGVYGLWMQQRLRNGQDVPDGHLDFAIEFSERHAHDKRLWGEFCIPQLLAWLFFRQSVEVSSEHDDFLRGLLDAISRANDPDSNCCLANPYYDAEDVLPHSLGLSPEPIKESFHGRSFYLESVLHLYARCNRKTTMMALFPQVTRVGFSHYAADKKWHFFRFDNGEDGTLHDRFMVPPHSWQGLKAAATEANGDELPTRLKQHPLHSLCMLMVMPHRVSSSFARWLATQMDNAAEDKSWL